VIKASQGYIVEMTIYGHRTAAEYAAKWLVGANRVGKVHRLRKGAHSGQFIIYSTYTRR